MKGLFSILVLVNTTIVLSFNRKLYITVRSQVYGHDHKNVGFYFLELYLLLKVFQFQSQTGYHFREINSLIAKI